MGPRCLEGEGCGGVEGWVRRGLVRGREDLWEGLRVGWEESKSGFEGGFEAVLSLVQHCFTSARRE